MGLAAIHKHYNDLEMQVCGLLCVHYCYIKDYVSVHYYIVRNTAFIYAYLNFLYILCIK